MDQMCVRARWICKFRDVMGLLAMISQNMAVPVLPNTEQIFRESRMDFMSREYATAWAKIEQVERILRAVLRSIFRCPNCKILNPHRDDRPMVI